MITEHGTMEDFKECVLTQIYGHVYSCGHIDIYILIDGKTCMFAHYREICERCKEARGIRGNIPRMRPIESRAEPIPYNAVYQYHPQWDA